jgi:hypothetical protein
LQSPLDLSDDHLDGDGVVPPARNDDVGISLTRLDKLLVHRLHGGQILIDDFIERPATLVGVAFDSANEPNVRVGVYEDFHIA